MAVFRAVILLATVSLAYSASAQSTDQIFPTPVRTSEIVSTIKARDIGDSRLTTHYYTFEGEQGDVFINVQSRSFTGDIDVFVMPAQTPLTKIIIYADQSETETGRVVYLRKPERLLLRIQGRTPGDDEATVRIKFAGSFAVSKLDDTPAPEVSRSGSSPDSNVRVNSVGTILEVIPKVKPTPDVVAEKTERVEDTPANDSKTESPEPKKEEATASTESEPKRKVEVFVTDSVLEQPNKQPVRRRYTSNRRTIVGQNTAPKIEPEKVESETEKPATTPPRRTTTATRRSRTAPEQPKKEEPPKVDPMANVRLVIYFKDGSTVDRPMTEVQRFSVERAVLTVIDKNGTIGRYNMTEVLRVSIE